MFNLHNFIFQRLIWKNYYCLFLVVWLLNSQGMKNCKITESFCRSILAIYTNDWSTLWYVYCCYVYSFSGKFLNVCKPRTTSHPLWQPGPHGLAFYVSGHAYQADWGWWMQAGSVLRNQKFSCKWNLSFCKAVPSNRLPFYLGSQLHIISSLSRHFRLWNYLENFGIYSQLNRKSKTWFFTFLNVYVCWIEREKILISQLSPPKFRYFADQNGRTPWKWNLTLQIQKRVSKTVRAQKVDEKIGSFV